MARVYAEIELEVTGSREPGDPSVGADPTVEDLIVERISILHYDHKRKTHKAEPLLDAFDYPLKITGDISAAFVEQLEEDMIEAIYDEDTSEEYYFERDFD